MSRVKDLLSRAVDNEYVRHGIVGLFFIVGLVALDVAFEAAIVARTVALVLAVMFAWRYSRRPWRTTREGRHLMSFTLIVAAFLVYATVNNVVTFLDAYPSTPDGSYPGREVIGLALYMLVAWELYQRNRLLSLAYRAKSRGPWLTGFRR